MKTVRIILTSVLLISSVSAPAQNIHLNNKTKAALEKVDKERIKKDITYLADDKLKGRLPGEKGYLLAVDYVVDQYKEMGLLPAGDNGTYLQKLILRKATLDSSLSNAVLKDISGKEESLVLGKEIFMIPNTLKNEIRSEAKLAFVGYGIDIPGIYSDYAGMEVEGKIVVFLLGAPQGLGLPSTLTAHFSNLVSKMEIAASKGAVGVMLAASDTIPMQGNTRVLSVSMSPDKTAAFGHGVGGNLNVSGRLSFTILQRLFMSAGKNLQQTLAALKNLTPASFEIPVSLRLQTFSTFKEVESFNVVGKIEGGDKNLKNQNVVHTAHLDHVGVGVPVNGDSIYNGAQDNASGVAVLLEIARTYKQIGSKPRRSVLMVMVTGEEMGLLGSAYFAANPVVPKSQIVADLNTDMPTLIAPLLSVVPLGAEHSSLEKNVAFACRQMGILVQKDPFPGENRFVRSDQYSFVLEGIPALHIKYGDKTNDPSFDLLKFTEQWKKQHYHKPSDEINNNFDFDAARTYVQLNFLISYSVAQTTKRPIWNKGDFFGKINVH